MYRDKKVGVVVPAWNEEEHIGLVLQGMPGFVDAVYVVDDASTDRTADIVRSFCCGDGTSRPRVELIQHPVNRGVGGAIVTGYKRALADGMDIATVMAGDNQMEPQYLPTVLDPVVDGHADYAKGTRLTHPVHLKGMSPWRTVGNFTLRWLTVIASGNRSITDPQNGYAATSREALEALDLDAVYPYYGYCNDLLIRLSAQHRRIVEIPHPSMYHGEVSKIRYRMYIPRVSMLLLRLFILRVTGRLSARRAPTVVSADVAPVEETQA